ncbi:hypothetical protein QYF36_002715 [Acer negundo]|nr:hypothetical protein QYF36_002715 [Acer negundo]
MPNGWKIFQSRVHQEGASSLRSGNISSIWVQFQILEKVPLRVKEASKKEGSDHFAVQTLAFCSNQATQSKWFAGKQGIPRRSTDVKLTSQPSFG